jgi:hypothetical protein
MIIKLAGVSKQIPWREQIDLLEVDALSDEYAWDDLLEAMEEGGSVGTVSRVHTPMPNFQRHGAQPVKVASAQNWDSEFSNAQAHARELMAKLGNG